MKRIINLLRTDGREFFISAYVEKLVAYKLTEEQALEFCSRNAREGLEPLETDENYSGYVALKLYDGYWVGKVNGRFIWLDPKRYKMIPSSDRYFRNGFCSGHATIISDSETDRYALEQGCLFMYRENDNDLCRSLLLIRDLDIAGELENNREYRDPDGDAEEIDKQLKDKLIAYIKGEEVEFSAEEQYLLSSHFPLDYRRIFRKD